MRENLVWIAMIVVILMVFAINYLQDTVNDELAALVVANTALIQEVETMTLQNRILILNAYGVLEDDDEISR